MPSEENPLNVVGRVRAEAALPRDRAAAPLAVAVLDGLSLSLDGAPLVLTNRKARGILAYLAIEGHAPVPREQMAGLFWGDVPERQARNSLRQAVFELREALQQHDCEALLAGRDTLALAPGSFVLDVETALAAIAAGKPPALGAAPGRAGRILAGYEDLSPLFRDWLGATRIALQARLQGALEAACTDAAAPRSTKCWARSSTRSLPPRRSVWWPRSSAARRNRRRRLCRSSLPRHSGPEGAC
jgi:DNA-binding SARP family transcriptional activator